MAGRDCIIVDALVDSGKRMERTVQELKKHGARRIYMHATHGVFSGEAMRVINDSPIEEVVVTNTIPLPQHVFCEKVQVLTVGWLLAEAIRRLVMRESISNLYHVTDTLLLDARYGDVQEDMQ